MQLSKDNNFTTIIKNINEMVDIKTVIQKGIDRVSKLRKTTPSLGLVKTILTDLRDNYDITPKTLTLTVKNTKAKNEVIRIGNILKKPNFELRSKITFPPYDRLKNGEFKKLFNSGKNMDSLLLVLKNYHWALKTAESQINESCLDNDIFSLYPNGHCLNYKSLLPIKERLPFEVGVYSGVSKLDYFHYKKLLTKYHKALEHAEKVLTKYNNFNRQ